ncbi:MAG TPA: glutamate racemase, partial [Rhabdochlamydiaceae bacterium]|nr:glutamate racemase [Rhabdochlamydiaceae bacterium]
MKNNQLPIGIFDSGLGGLTVMKELIKILPHENILYFADNAHLPYGEKSKSYLKERSLAITSFFEEKRVKLIVVACHTASANA